MLLEIEGICQHCAESVKLLQLKDELRGMCQSCGRQPFTARPIKGVVYILKNDHQAGVKIGKTTQYYEDRIRQLNSATGVPGKFYPIAIFLSKSPGKDESKVHEKLARHRLDKEHFTLDPIEAVLKTYRTLGRKVPIFFNDITRRRFELELEKARIEMDEKLGRKSA